MKSTIKSIIAAVVVALACASCGTTGLGTLGQVAGAILTNGQTNGQTGTTTTNNGGSILGGVLGAVTNGDALGNILGSVIGLDKMTEESIVGTWKYQQPGVAFTSDKLLAKAGGEAVSQKGYSQFHTAVKEATEAMKEDTKKAIKVFANI